MNHHKQPLTPFGALVTYKASEVNPNVPGKFDPSGTKSIFLGYQHQTGGKVAKDAVLCPFDGFADIDYNIGKQKRSNKRPYVDSSAAFSMPNDLLVTLGKTIWEFPLQEAYVKAYRTYAGMTSRCGKFGWSDARTEEMLGFPFRLRHCRAAR